MHIFTSTIVEIAPLQLFLDVFFLCSARINERGKAKRSNATNRHLDAIDLKWTDYTCINVPFLPA